MDTYEFRLKPGTFVTLNWVLGFMACKMYGFTCADGSVGAMDERSFHQFYKLVDTN